MELEKVLGRRGNNKSLRENGKKPESQSSLIIWEKLILQNLI